MKGVPFANASAFVGGLIFVLCLLGILFAKDLFVNVANSFFHGIDLAALPVKEVSLSSSVIGFITVVVGAWILGYIFAYCYNWCGKRFK